MDTEYIQTRLDKNLIPCRKELPEKLNIYFMMLKEWNSRMDLTAATDDDEMLDRHFVDSLTVLKYGIIKAETKLIDVGTGAGFPGMVLAMARPDLQVTLLDSQEKRLMFLQAVGENAGIRNIKTVHARAEDGSRNPALREMFDYAAARAVAPLNVLCEYMLPYVRVEGYALCWKGPALRNEIDCGRRAAHLLGGRMEMPVQCPVEGREWEHVILPVHKVHRTSAVYPRKAGMPKNKPLG